MHKDTKRLFPVKSDALPDDVLHALLMGDENELQEALWKRVEPYVANEPPDFREYLKYRLPGALLTAFGEVLKD